MSTSKRSAIGASNLNTGRFTRPIILKMIGAFCVTALLGAAIISFALFNIKQSSDTGQQLLDLQEASNFARDLTGLVKEQQKQAELILFENQPPADYYQIIGRIESGYRSYGLVKLDPSSQFWEKKSQIQKIVEQNAPLPLEARPPNIRQLLQELSGDMTRLATYFSDSLSQQAHFTLINLSQSQQTAFTTMVIISVLALLVAAVVAWFVISAIVQPMRLMNEQLSQLLWSQNEHLTERLNILQQEINTNNEMLTAVRHDLKAPLGNVKSLAQLSLITQPDLGDDAQHNLQKIIEVADNSVATVSNLLARREIALNLQKVSLAELIDKVLQLVDLRWFNITRRVEVAEAVIDVGLMEHALLNLVSNARKFSGGGIGIGASTTIKAGTVDEEELKLWVWNDGTVITAADREEIFKPGVQTGEGRKAGGHGLGLAIVKSIAERHHGRVVVESHEKKGTTFSILIPIQSLETNPLAATTPLRAEIKPPENLASGLVANASNE